MTGAPPGVPSGELHVRALVPNYKHAYDRDASAWKETTLVHVVMGDPIVVRAGDRVLVYALCPGLNADRASRFPAEDIVKAVKYEVLS